MEEIKTGNVYCIGDTHSLDFLSLLVHYKLKDFVLIHVGDAGEGFTHKDMPGINNDRYYLNLLEQYCDNHNGRILITRGNHSNPEYYTDKHWTRSTYKNIEFVKDYDYKLINGSVFLFVGGATSIDRQVREEPFDYWKDEVFFLPVNFETLEPCDVLITHSSPDNAYPIDGLSKIRGWFTHDPDLPSELNEERQKIAQLVEKVNPKINIYGHFHSSESERIDGTWYRCLDINEVIDITKEINNEKVY